MPKVKASKQSFLRQLVSEFGDEVFSTDGSILFCKLCEIKVSAEKRFTVQQHVRRDKHLNAVVRAKETKTRQLLLGESAGESSSKTSAFYKDLCEALVSANIPLAKINNTKFKQFLQQYTGQNIPDESTLRKGYLERCYEDTIGRIRRCVQNKKIFVSIDETSDQQKRSIANVVIGTLEVDSPPEVFLLTTEVLDKVNYQTICKLFDKSMYILWPQGIKHDNVLLFLSDAAPYMVKAGKAIKAFYTKIIHVTCLAHALHRVSEQVREKFPQVDKLISNVKKVFLKSPSRIRAFHESTSDTPLPPEPILTRWGTWISACTYYCNHFDVLKSVIDSFDRESATSVAVSQDVFADPDLKGSLAYINSNFSILTKAITWLEKRGESIHSVLKKIKDVEQQLKNCAGAIGQDISVKMEKVLKNNTGYQTMCKVEKILHGENFDFSVFEEDFSPGDLAHFNYAPLTSVEVERSFSMYRNVLQDNRQSFKFENLRMTMVLYCNAQ